MSSIKIALKLLCLKLYTYLFILLANSTNALWLQFKIIASVLFCSEEISFHSGHFVKTLTSKIVFTHLRSPRLWLRAEDHARVPWRSDVHVTAFSSQKHTSSPWKILDKSHRFGADNLILLKWFFYCSRVPRLITISLDQKWLCGLRWSSRTFA